MTEWRDAAERGRDSGRRSPFEMVGETGLLEVDETRGSWRVPGGEHEPAHECEEQEAHTTHQSSHVLKMIHRISCARVHSEISLQALAAYTVTEREVSCGSHCIERRSWSRCPVGEYGQDQAQINIAHCPKAVRS